MAAKRATRRPPSKDPIRRAMHLPDERHSVAMLKGTGGPARGPELEKPRDLIGVLGPGLITGASDADPGGIGTYSQSGSQTGFGLLWTALFTYPLMTAVQEMCGRIALQTGQGLGRVLARKLPTWVVGLLILSLVVANVFNVGADLGAVGAALALISGNRLSGTVVVAPMGLLILAAVAFFTYERIAALLKWLALVLFAYVITAVLSQPPLLEVVRSTFVPHIEMNATFIGDLVAVFGTTITPYLFFWQASSEVDTRRQEGQRRLEIRRGVSPKRLRLARIDILIGTLSAQVVMYAILLTSGQVLHHSANAGAIQSADQAAQSLSPLGGGAPIIFSLGIIGTGLLAIPVMAGSAVYAVREFFNFGGSMGLKVRYRPTFYILFAVAMLIAIAMNYLGLNPIHALVLSAALNGIVAPPLLAAITAVARDRRIMKNHVSGRWSFGLCVAATVVMGLAVVGLLASILIGG